jgi:nucleoside-diphosphate-sugar epimerase
MRPGAFYGPWGHYGLNRLLFDDFLRGIRIQVHHGRHITFPVYVKDVCWAIETLLERGRLGEIYNVSGESIPHRQASDIISRLAAKSTWRFNAPEGLMVTVARIMEILARFTRREPWYPLNLYPYIFYDWPVSSQKARRELGFHPTPFEDGARQTLEWYQANGFPSSLLSMVLAFRYIF